MLHCCATDIPCRSCMILIHIPRPLTPQLDSADAIFQLHSSKALVQTPESTSEKIAIRVRQSFGMDAASEQTSSIILNGNLQSRGTLHVRILLCTEHTSRLFWG